MRAAMRILSLVMLIVAIAFVLIAVSTPTLGSVFYLGSIRLGAEQWRVFYVIYVVILVALFVGSFFVRRK